MEEQFETTRVRDTSRTVQAQRSTRRKSVKGMQDKSMQCMDLRGGERGTPPRAVQAQRSTRTIGKGRITRLFVDPSKPECLLESMKKVGDFTIDGSRNTSITKLLDSGESMLLKKTDADKVKRHTGKSYEFVRKAEWEKTLAKRAKTRAKAKASEAKHVADSLAFWSQAPEERDERERFFMIPEEKLDPKALAKAREEKEAAEFQDFLKSCDEQAAKRQAAKRQADSTIITTEPKGENQEYEIKTASGVTICTHRTVDLANTKEAASDAPELPKDEPKKVSKLPSPQKVQRVILPYTDAEIPVPANLELSPMLTLIREHKGITHRVTITQDLKFLYEGTVYKTLTEISWKAAGYQISGNAFFGLPSKKRK